MRDFLHEWNVRSDDETIDTLGREMKAAAARARFEKATADIASGHHFGGPDAQTNEIDMLEEATALTRAATERS